MSDLRLLQLNLVHSETWSSAGSVRLSAHAEVLPVTTSREQDAPTTFKNYGSQNRCGLRWVLTLRQCQLLFLFFFAYNAPPLV